MKTLALLATLVLHTTGLWEHLPESSRDRLTTLATADRPIAALQAPAPPHGALGPAVIGPLPVRLGTENFTTNLKSAFALDTATGAVLYSHQPTTQLPIASVTKMVTALVILSRHQPTDMITLPKLPDYLPYDERLGLNAGETYSVGDLLDAVLVNSANDAADGLALYDAGTTAKFAARMNTKMTEWGITGTHFTNPTGLFDENNYATAEALAKIARLALTNSFVRESILKQNSTITSTSGRIIPIHTTNKLLATGQFYGIKTGYTPAAGECFVGLTRIEGHEVITVVLGASDRFGATQSLTNWISRNYQWL